MKIETYKIPQSSFLSIEKDLAIIMELIFKNNNLKKLLYYTTPDCLSKPNLTEDQTLELISNNIKLTPEQRIDPKVMNYLFIKFNSFVPSSNKEFRTNLIEFDICCHFDQWHLKDYQMRPYRIAAEIDSMLQNQRLTGIGEVEFVNATDTIMHEEFVVFCIRYRVYHGGEDKKNIPNEIREEEMIKNFDEIFNED